MPQKIRITVGAVSLAAELADTDCAKAIAGKLPIDAVPNEWGDEFYFSIPVKLPLDAAATRKVKIGDIGYWPPGSALAIFFGRTPMSTGPDPVPASEVNLVGRIIDDALLLKKAKGAGKIRIEKG
ncbi:MAG TPA: cyclophilin-like fold protein [Syntrophales bacterium]|nr:cyclophilin-like fold protein [Syntrophales bacterium]